MLSFFYQQTTKGGGHGITFLECNLWEKPNLVKIVEKLRDETLAIHVVPLMLHRVPRKDALTHNSRHQEQMNKIMEIVKAEAEAREKIKEKELKNAK